MFVPSRRKKRGKLNAKPPCSSVACCWLMVTLVTGLERRPVMVTGRSTLPDIGDLGFKALWKDGFKREIGMWPT